MLFGVHKSNFGVLKKSWRVFVQRTMQREFQQGLSCKSRSRNPESKQHLKVVKLEIASVLAWPIHANPLVTL